MASENEQRQARKRADPSSREVRPEQPTRNVGVTPGAATGLSAEEQERRTALAEVFQQACEAIDDAVAHIPPEELERLQREWIEDADDAIRRRAARSMRQAS